jgi:hypothetical protein
VFGLFLTCSQSVRENKRGKKERKIPTRWRKTVFSSLCVLPFSNVCLTRRRNCRERQSLVTTAKLITSRLEFSHRLTFLGFVWSIVPQMWTLATACRADLHGRLRCSLHRSSWLFSCQHSCLRFLSVQLAAAFPGCSACCTMLRTQYIRNIDACLRTRVCLLLPRILRKFELSGSKQKNLGFCLQVGNRSARLWFTCLFWSSWNSESWNLFFSRPLCELTFWKRVHYVGARCFEKSTFLPPLNQVSAQWAKHSRSNLSWSK